MDRYRCAPVHQDIKHGCAHPQAPTEGPASVGTGSGQNIQGIGEVFRNHMPAVLAKLEGGIAATPHGTHAAAHKGTERDAAATLLEVLEVNPDHGAGG